MISVSDAFKKFKSNLELTQREQKDASRRQKEIRAHLANTFDMSIDGAEVQAPLWMRIMARMMKKRAITKPMSPGFKLPQNMTQQVIAPESTTTEEAVPA